MLGYSHDNTPFSGDPFNGISGQSPASLPPDAIAIVGAACRLPGANNLEQLWGIVSNKVSKVEEVGETRIRLHESFRVQLDKEWTERKTFYGNFIDDVDAFDNAFFAISPRESMYMDPQQRLLLSGAVEAMDASGYLRSHQCEDGDAVGCFIGASYTEYTENTSSYAPSAFTATGTIRAFLSGRISHYFGWTGPSEVIDTACSASLVAIHRACQALKTGECSMALAGGVNVLTGVQNFFDLGKAGFLSLSGQCKPFDKAADGYCRADGVGMVAMKLINSAIADGNHILGVIPATATNQGGLSSAITVPHSPVQIALYRNMLKKANVKPYDVSYIEAHGSGTQVGDPIEIASIREVFGGPDRHTVLSIGSVKANIGHSETAAGVTGLLKVLTMFAHRGIPPLAGFDTLNPKIPPLGPSNLDISKILTSWPATSTRTACVSSYGASGSNAALLCSEYLEDANERPRQSTALMKHVPVLLTASSKDGLQFYARDLLGYLRSPRPDLIVDNLAFTLSERRQHHLFRW